MLCFDKGTNQYFIASDEQVKIVENRMNDILKRIISEGNEIITLSEVMDALSIGADQKDDNDQKKGEQRTMEKFTKITKEEFCKATRTNPDCWIFKNLGENHRFWRDSLEDGRYYFDDGNGTIHRFKDMPEYGEIHHAVREHGVGKLWSMWSTWCKY